MGRFEAGGVGWAFKLTEAPVCFPCKSLTFTPIKIQENNSDWSNFKLCL